MEHAIIVEVPQVGHATYVFSKADPESLSIGSMPPFAKGRIVKLSLEDQLWLKMAQKHRIIFNETQLIYDAILDVDSGEFRAVDSTECGI